MPALLITKNPVAGSMFVADEDNAISTDERVPNTIHSSRRNPSKTNST